MSLRVSDVVVDCWSKKMSMAILCDKGHQMKVIFVVIHRLSRWLITARKRSLGQGNIFTPVILFKGEGGVSQHAPGSHYISSCTGVG